jgi:hypothetical protein
VDKLAAVAMALTPHSGRSKSSDVDIHALRFAFVGAHSAARIYIGEGQRLLLGGRCLSRTPLLKTTDIFASVAPDWHRPSLLTLHREEERFSIIARISASLTLQQSRAVSILHIDACGSQIEVLGRHSFRQFSRQFEAVPGLK